MASPPPLSCIIILILCSTAAVALPPPLLNRYSLPSVSNVTTEVFDLTPRHPFPDTPLCSIRLLQLSHTSSSSSNYTPPDPHLCPWTSAALELSAYAHSPSPSPDRVAAVWLAGVELLRTSTPVPTAAGVRWTTRRDVTRYSSSLARSAVVSVALDADSAAFLLNLTLLFYGAPGKPEAEPSRLRVLYGEPADVVVPLSEAADRFPWRRIGDSSGRLAWSLPVPNNTRRAVLEVSASAHGDDEFWYSNPPSFFPGVGRRGGGPVRQLSITVDGAVASAPVPFPAVYSGGVNPLLWTPVTPAASFVLPTHDVELTPLLGRLIDGEAHELAVRVGGALPFWLVGASLHLWLDPAGVSAGTTKHEAPGGGSEAESRSGGARWEFEARREGRLRISGWVASSLGNMTTDVEEEVEISGKVAFSGPVGEVEFAAEYGREVRVVEGGRRVLARMKQKARLPVEARVVVAEAEEGRYRAEVRVARSVAEEVELEYGGRRRRSAASGGEEGGGWVVVGREDGLVVRGGASVVHRYSSAGTGGCYERTVVVVDGEVREDLLRNTCSTDGAADL